MLKRLLIITILIITATAISCGGKSGPVLDMREAELEILCDITIGETENSIKVILYPFDGNGMRSGEIELLSPQELCGVKVIFGNDGTFIAYDNIKIPIPVNSFSTGLLSALFSLEDVNITALRANNEGNTEIEAGCESGSFLLVLDKKTSHIKEASGTFDGKSFSLSVREYNRK